MAFGKFSTSAPVEVVASGGMLVRQVDVNGAALDDPTDSYGTAMPVTLVDGAGVNENGSATFSVWLKVTLSPDGVPVIRTDSIGNAVSTPFGDVTIPTLDPLTLNTSTVAENASAATVVGTIQGKSASSVLSLVDDAGGRFALAGNDIQATGSGLNYESATSHDITVRETLAGASNTPRDNIITITVTNVLEVTLNAITVSSQNSFPENTTPTFTVATLAGKTSGSTLSVVGDSRFSCSGSNLQFVSGTLDYETEPSINLTIRETHADGSNSPRDSTISITVSNVDEGGGSGLSAPVLTATTTTENPPEWDSDFDDFVTWDGVDDGDQHRLIWRFGGTGSWTTEDWQGLDDELLSGGFTWPLYEAAKTNTYVPAGIVEVKEQRRRMVGGVQSLISDESNTLSFTVDAPPALWDPTDNSASYWYDFTDTANMFTTSGGSTNVAADADPIGRIVNKGSASDNAVQATSGDRPTYRTASTCGSAGVRIQGGSNTNAGLDITGNFGDLGEVAMGGAITGITAMLTGIARPIDLTNTRLISIQWDHVAGTAKFFAEGSQVGATATGLTLTNSGIFVCVVNALSAGNFSAGRIFTPTRLFNRAADGRAFDGDCAVMMKFDVADDTIRQKAEGYCNFLGCNFTIVSGHPYETVPPSA